VVGNLIEQHVGKRRLAGGDLAEQRCTGFTLVGKNENHAGVLLLGDGKHWHFAAARRASAGPQIDNHGPASCQTRQVYGLTGKRRQLHRGQR
jgi:hypothetical protein